MNLYPLNSDNDDNGIPDRQLNGIIRTNPKNNLKRFFILLRETWK